MFSSAIRASKANHLCLRTLRASRDLPDPSCSKISGSCSSSPVRYLGLSSDVPAATKSAVCARRHLGVPGWSGVAKASASPPYVSDRNVADLPLTSIEAPPLEEVELEEDSKDAFDWAHAWYPVAVLSDLDKRRPHALTLLGGQYVAWWDRNAEEWGGRWQVFQDLCPHRLAPLSEGRIHENGQLQCSYHGWTFKGNGGCTWIPQAPKDGPEVHAHPKACAIRCPAVEHQHMLWMMPSTGTKAFQVAAQTKPPLIPELDDPSFVFDFGLRDLPYGYEMLIENLMDPAHVPFAHHRIMGNRDTAKPLELKVKHIDKNGFVGSSAQMGEAVFYPPCTFVQTLNIPPKDKDGKVKPGPPSLMKLIFFCVPTSPGHSRNMYTFPRNFATFANRLIPRWIQHMPQMTVLDSDLIFLHLQERMLEETGGLRQRTKSNYLPTASDAFVAGYRFWLNKFAGGGPSWPPTVDPRLPPIQPKEVLMDRYHSHVVHCKACSGAHEKMTLLKGVFQVASFVLLALVSAAAATRRMPVVESRAIPLAFLSVVLFLASKLLALFLKKFHFQDYVHAFVK